MWQHRLGMYQYSFRKFIEKNVAPVTCGLATWAVMAGRWRELDQSASTLLVNLPVSRWYSLSVGVWIWKTVVILCHGSSNNRIVNTDDWNKKEPQPVRDYPFWLSNIEMAHAASALLSDSYFFTIRTNDLTQSLFDRFVSWHVEIEMGGVIVYNHNCTLSKRSHCFVVLCTGPWEAGPWDHFRRWFDRAVPPWDRVGVGLDYSAVSVYECVVDPFLAREDARYHFSSERDTHQYR